MFCRPDKAKPQTIILIISLLLFASRVPGSDQHGLEETIRAKYFQTVFRLRGFYQNSHLHFDTRGEVKGNAKTGAWTLSRVEIDKVTISADKIELEGPRIADASDSRQLSLEPVRIKRTVHIVIDRDPSQPETVAPDAVARIFLNENDRLADIVPDYWKAYVSGRLEIVRQAGLPDCYRIKGRVQRTGDGTISIPCEEHRNAHFIAVNPTTLDIASLSYKVGKDVIPPQPIYTPGPPYTSDHRSAKYRGESVLELTVTAKGYPENIEVIRPLGLGLDDEAVEAVNRWRFVPASLKGHLVPVRINVEVSFWRP